MKKFRVRALLASLFLFAFSSLHADNTQVIQEFFSPFFSQPLPSLCKTTFNLNKYRVDFQDPTLPTEIVYVDAENRYIVFDEKIVTDPQEIHRYLKNSTPLPPSFSIYNLDAFLALVPFNDSYIQQIVYIDRNRQYAMVGDGNISTINGNVAFINADLANHEAFATQLYQESKNFFSIKSRAVLILPEASLLWQSPIADSAMIYIPSLNPLLIQGNSPFSGSRPFFFSLIPEAKDWRF